MRGKTMEELIREKEIDRRNRDAERFISHVNRERTRRIIRMVEIAAFLSAAGWVALILSIACK